MVTLYQAPRKPRSVSQSTTISANLNKTTSLSGEVVSGVQSEHMVSDRWASTNDEVSTGFATGMASPPLPPIGTPATSTDAVTERRSLATKYVYMTLVCMRSLFGCMFF